MGFNASWGILASDESAQDENDGQTPFPHHTFASLCGRAP